MQRHVDFIFKVRHKNSSLRVLFATPLSVFVNVMKNSFSNNKKIIFSCTEFSFIVLINLIQYPRARVPLSQWSDNDPEFLVPGRFRVDYAPTSEIVPEVNNFSAAHQILPSVWYAFNVSQSLQTTKELRRQVAPLTSFFFNCPSTHSLDWKKPK